MPLEIFIVIARVVFSTMANVFQKQLTHQHFHPFFVVMASYLVLGLLSIPLLPLVNFQQIPTDFWPAIMAAAALDMAGTLFLVMSLSKTDLSVFGPLNAYKVVISMLLAIVFLGEIPSLQGFAGVAIILLGSFLLFPPGTKKQQTRLSDLFLHRGVQYRFLSILLFSIGTLPLKTAVTLADPLSTTLFWCLFGIPLAVASHQLWIKQPFDQQLAQTKNHITRLIYLGTMIFLMQYMTMLVLSKMIIAYSLALFQLSMVLHVFLGYRIFKEQHIQRRLFACLIIVTGSITVLYS